MNDEEKKSTTLDRATFQAVYAGSAPWDIGRPQPAFEAVAEKIIGSILDAGCGTGEHALFFAARGHQVTGFDFLEEPIAAAKRKAAERGIAATFLVEDALKLKEWTARFDNVLDSGLFHTFSDEDRVLYLLGLKTVLKPGGRLYLLCFSDKTPGTFGPRRVPENELREAFHHGWDIESVEPAQFEIRPDTRGLFSGENPRTHFLVARHIA